MPPIRLFKFIEVSREIDQRSGVPVYVIRGQVMENMPGVELCRTTDDSSHSETLVKIMSAWWSAQVHPLPA